MKAEGKILMPMYDAANGDLTNYVSYVSITLQDKHYQEEYITTVEVFKELQADKSKKKSYIAWLESYLKRKVGTTIINNEANFTYK